MHRNAIIAALVAASSVLGVLVLFSIQNSSRTTQLSLDLFVAAWQLQTPVSIPLLMGSCLGAGWLLGALMFGLQSAGRARRIKALEREIALGGGGGKSW